MLSLVNLRNNKRVIVNFYHLFKLVYNYLALEIAPDMGHCSAENFLFPTAANTIPVIKRVSILLM